MTLPEFEVREEQGSGGSRDPLITSNHTNCPHCGVKVTYDREAYDQGEEETCFKCNQTFQIPAFSDDPAVVLGRTEESFLNRREDDAFDGDSDYHGGSSAINLDEWWGRVVA